MTLSFFGYFFVPGPLGDLKKCLGDIFGHTELSGSFTLTMFSLSKNRIFYFWGDSFDRVNYGQILKIFDVFIFTRLCP